MKCDTTKNTATNVTEAYEQGYQAGIDEAVEIVENNRKEVDEFPDSYSETLLFHREDGYNQALDDTKKALQDKK